MLMLETPVMGPLVFPGDKTLVPFRALSGVRKKPPPLFVGTTLKNQNSDNTLVG